MDTRIFLLFSQGIQHFPQRIRMTNISKINWKATIQIQTEHFKLICTAFSVYVETSNEYIRLGRNDTN